MLKFSYYIYVHIDQVFLLQSAKSGHFKIKRICSSCLCPKTRIELLDSKEVE